MKLNVMNLYKEAISSFSFTLCSKTNRVGISLKDDEQMLKTINEKLDANFEYATFEYLQQHHPMETLVICSELFSIISSFVAVKAKELLHEDNPEISIDEVLLRIKDELVVNILPDHVDIEEESRELIISRPIEEVYEFSEISQENIAKVEKELSEIIEKVKNSRKSTLKVNSKNRTLDFILQDNLGFLRIQEDWSEHGNTYMINLTSN